jgi:23S rRNA (cytosine1962-C5)-methyltransferase
VRTFVLREGRARPAWGGHPWVHAESADEGPATSDDGAGAEGDDVALVTDAAGRPVGRAFVSPRSAIRLRLIDRAPEARPVEALLEERVEAAAALRRRLFPPGAATTAYRLVHAEGDGLPGLVVDRWGDVLVAQFAIGATHRRREALAAHLLRASGARSLLAREGGYEAEEGIDVAAVPFAAGEPAPARVEVEEAGLRLVVEPALGQKTGHFADQRENRTRVAEVAGGGEVLDLYGGTGGFSLQALRLGARSAELVDASPRATSRAVENAALNGLADRFVATAGEVREALAARKAEGRLYDVVVADPPNFHPPRGESARAERAYRDLNVQAILRVRPGGFLATFTCSARVPREAFAELVLSAARECRRPVRVLRELSAGPDHPVLLAQPEGRYLTGLLLGVPP